MGMAERAQIGGALMALLAVVMTGCDVPDEEERRERLHLPSGDVKPDPERGKALFKANCAGCHGPDARGTNKGPPLIHRLYRPGRHADLAFHLAVRNGVDQHHWQFGDMPPMPGISPDAVEHMIAFVRGEQARAGITE